MFRLAILFLCFVFTIEGSVDSVCRQLTEAARATDTDEIVVMRKGNPLFHYKVPNAPERYDLEDMTGLFWSLAVGTLIDQQKIPCLDAPVSTFVRGFTGKITIRNLLNHTTALPKWEDFRLLQSVIGQASGKHARDYVGETVLMPLGISNFSWTSVDGLDSLMLRAVDLAKVGELLAAGGQCGCQRILSHYWLNLLGKPSQDDNPFWGQQIWLEYSDLGIYWDPFLVEYYAHQGVNEGLLKKLTSLDRREIHFGGSAVRGKALRLWGKDLFPEKYWMGDLICETYSKNLPLGYFSANNLKAWIAWGGCGQQLIVIPQDGFVGVRLANHSSDIFVDFLYLVDAFSKQY